MDCDENGSRIFSQARQGAVKGASKGEWIAMRTSER
jgi:hypothetical protein